MQTRPASRPESLTRLAAKTILCFVSASLFLAWLGFGPGTGEFGGHLRREFSRATGFCLACRRGDVDPTLAYVRTALDAGDITPELEIKAKEFALGSGLQIQLTGQDFHYLLSVHNQRLELFLTPATAQGLTDAEAKLEAVVQQKVDGLARAPYLASFAVENEVVEKQKSFNKDGTTVEGDKIILARRPRLGELYGVEAALERSNPSYLAPGDKTGIKFYFLKDSLYKGEDHFAYYATDKDGKAAVYITAGTTDKLAPTELDAPTWALPKRFGPDGTFFATVESMLLHELSHNHQARMGWDRSPDKRKQMTEATGFVSYLDSKTNQTIYLIKVLPKDQPLQYYRLESRSVDDKEKRWQRTDMSGKWLDQDGHEVDSQDQAMTLSNKQIRAQALVTPSSNYFDNPDEIFAEAMEALRMGGAARQSLFSLSPQLYGLVKEEDQQELNAAYGSVKVVENRTLVKAGQESALEPVTRVDPTFIRDWDGLVVPMSESALQTLAQCETSAGVKAGS